MANIDQLVKETQAAFDAMQADKFGRKSVTVAHGDVECTIAAKAPRNSWSTSKVTMGFKQGGKVVSRASLEGDKFASMNPSMLIAFEAQAPELAREYIEFVQRAHTQAVADLGPAMPLPYVKSTRYSAGDENASRREFLATYVFPVCDIERAAPANAWTKGEVVAVTLNEAKLQETANEYGKQAAMNWFYKTNEKMGEIENAEVVSGKDSYLIVNGEKAGKKVSIRQQRIGKYSPKGTYFHQFPALLYVDDKFVTEADYKKIFNT